MMLNVGDKIRAYIHAFDGDDGGEEITTTILDTNDEAILVKWEHGNSLLVDGKRVKAWWIYKDMTLSKPECAGNGKALCKNWRKYKEK